MTQPSEKHRRALRQHKFTNEINNGDQLYTPYPEARAMIPHQERRAGPGQASDRDPGQSRGRPTLFRAVDVTLFHVVKLGHFESAKTSRSGLGPGSPGRRPAHPSLMNGEAIVLSNLSLLFGLARPKSFASPWRRQGALNSYSIFNPGDLPNLCITPNCRGHASLSARDFGMYGINNVDAAHVLRR
jgi:hypothetical protein